MPKSKRQTRAALVIPRAQIARLVQRRITDAGLTRTLAATLVGDAASQMSLLMSNHLASFSSERLIRMLTRLGADVDILVRQRERLGPRGKVRIISVPVPKKNATKSATKSATTRQPKRKRQR
jgi:predicted XRE-type DNA-binding protein